jgi:hypothetical protein
MKVLRRRTSCSKFMGAQRRFAEQRIEMPKGSGRSLAWRSSEKSFFEGRSRWRLEAQVEIARTASPGTVTGEDLSKDPHRRDRWE